MPQVKDFVSIAAGATVNVMAGRVHRTIGGGGGQVKVYATATGGNVGELRATLLLGTDTVIDQAGLAVQAQGPVIPDDQVAEGLGVPGDEIFLNVHNTTAGALTVGFVVAIENF